jgi:TetR/AcrR family transcriptional repressor of nem operon
MHNPSSTADGILACARSLISSGGYNGFSYADIAGMVGIGKAGIHHHFPNKVDLVRTLVRRYHEETQASFARLEKTIDGPLDQLRAYVDAWKNAIGDNSAPFCVCAVLASEVPVLPDEVANEIDHYFRFLAGWLTAVMARGVLRGAITLSWSPQVEAEAFMALVHGAMLSARAYGDTATFGLIMEPALTRLAPAQLPFS